MAVTMKSLLTIVALATTVLGHARVINPEPRRHGDAFEESCGLWSALYIQSSPAGVAEKLLNEYSNPATCDPFVCRGALLADSPDLVYAYAPGTVIPMEVEFWTPHEGFANVSVIDLRTKRTIGTPLITWPSNYGMEPYAEDQMKFSVTVPDLQGACAEPGDCALHWWWEYKRPTDYQHFMDCIDFVQ